MRDFKLSFWDSERDLLMGFVDGYPPKVKHGLPKYHPFVDDFLIKTLIRGNSHLAMFDCGRVDLRKILLEQRFFSLLYLFRGCYTVDPC